MYYVLCLFKHACVRFYGGGLFILENDVYYVGKVRNITQFRDVLGYLH